MSSALGAARNARGDHDFSGAPPRRARARPGRRRRRRASWCRAGAASSAWRNGAALRLEVALVAAADLGEDRLRSSAGSPRRAKLVAAPPRALLRRSRSRRASPRRSGRPRCRCRARRARRRRGCAAKRRCRSRSASRTGWKAETTEAASPISRPRRRASSKRLRSSSRATTVAAPTSVEGAAVVEERAGDRAVEQTGVEMRQAEMRGEPLRERALAGGRRSVDGDDHQAARIPAPSSRISGTKVGKLVCDHGAVVDRHAARGRRAP